MAILKEELEKIKLGFETPAGRRFWDWKFQGTKVFATLEWTETNERGQYIGQHWEDVLAGTLGEEVIPFIPSGLVATAAYAAAYNEEAVIFVNLGLRSEVMAWRRALLEFKD